MGIVKGTLHHSFSIVRYMAAKNEKRENQKKEKKEKEKKMLFPVGG